MIRMNRVFSVVAMNLLICQATFSWGPIAHYIITKEALGANGAGVAPYSNLPDAWASNDWPLNLQLNVNVSEHFCWSHNVKDTGLVAGYCWGIFCNVPKRPEYHDDFAQTEPGAFMMLLVEDKLDFSRTISSESTEKVWGIKAEQILACRGFSAHNKADEIVHWRYFMAPVPTSADLPTEDLNLICTREGSPVVPQTDDDRRNAWTIHHGLKESWAEYVIFAQKVLNKSDLTYEDFDDDGKFKMERLNNGVNEPHPPEDLPVLAIPELHENGYDNQKINALARLLRLAQAVYRKNRMVRSTEHADEYGVEVQSVTKIKQLLRVQNEHLAHYFNLGTWTMWEATLTTDNGFPVNFQFNFADGEAEIQVAAGEAGKITHEYEDPEDQMTDWLMLQYLEENEYAKTRKDRNGNDITLQELPAYQWDRTTLWQKFNEAVNRVRGN